MKQIVMINKETGELGVCIKVNFFEKWTEDREISSLGEHSIGLIPKNPDGFLTIVREGSPFIFVPAELVRDEVVDFLGDL